MVALGVNLCVGILYAHLWSMFYEEIQHKESFQLI